MALSPLRLIALSAAVGALAALPAAAPAEAKLKPKLGIYDCYTVEESSYFGTPTRSYNSSIKFLRKNRYEHTFGRKGKKMVQKTSGTYRVKRGKIIFKRGAMDKIRAKLRRSSVKGNPPLFDVLHKGKPTGIGCTHLSAK